MTTLIPKFEQVGVTTVNRPITEKLAEIVSVKDFGAVGDGSTDDTVAIQAALTTGKTVYVPQGTYKISATLSPVASSSLIGDGPAVTIFNYIADVHGFTFPIISNDRAKKIFSGFSMQTTPSVTNAKYAFYFPGTDVAVATTTYCKGYTFRDIEINNALVQFAGGFRLKDTFRTTIENVGMSYGAIGIKIEGQCVQTAITRFIGNFDGVNTQFGADDNSQIGLITLPSNAYFGGVTNVAEGLIVTGSDFVNSVKGFSGSALECVIEGCAFDLYRGGVGVELLQYGSAVIFRNNWVSPVSGNSNHGIPGSTSGVIGILTRTSTFTAEATLIDGNTVYAGGTLPNGGQAICVGDAGFSPNIQTKGTVISNNFIRSNPVAGSQWTNGIQVDRSRAIRILNNTIYDESGVSCCLTAGINVTYQNYTYCVGNYCVGTSILFSCFVASGFGSVSDNQTTTFTNSSAAPYVAGNWSLVRNLPG